MYTRPCEIYKGSVKHSAYPHVAYNAIGEERLTGETLAGQAKSKTA